MSDDKNKVLVSFSSDNPDKQRLLNDIMQLEEDRIKDFFSDLIDEHAKPVNLDKYDSMVEIEFDPEAFSINKEIIKRGAGEGTLQYMINRVESTGRVKVEVQEEGDETICYIKNEDESAVAWDSDKVDFLALVSAAENYYEEFGYHPIWGDEIE